MFARGVGPKLGKVRIVITIDRADPPEGHIARNHDDEPTAFVGWLGLIRLLADAVVALDGETVATDPVAS